MAQLIHGLPERVNVPMWPALIFTPAIGSFESASTTVTRDEGELEALFPDFYAGEVTLTLRDGRQVHERSDIARGYPEAPLSETDLNNKFHALVGSVADDGRREALEQLARTAADQADMGGLATLLGAPAKSLR